MKKTIYFCMLLLSSYMFSQFSPTGTSLITNIFRNGSVGLGYTTAPVFGTNKFMVNGNSYFSGNIGIGTTSPYSMFHMPNGQMTIGNYFEVWNDVNSNIGIKSSKTIVVNSGNNILGAVEVSMTGTTAELAVARCNGCYSSNAILGDAITRGNSNGSFIISNEHNGNIKFETGNVAEGTSKIQMLINNIGNVGIGTGNSTLNPLEKLAVNGLIHTKEVKVDLIGWPDYVFEEDYKLLSLTELEKSIKENKHLPGIPTANEVEENGLNLGEINKKLIQKIEELTLYIIEMNKEIEALKSKL